jgi:hypothetical protein
MSGLSIREQLGRAMAAMIAILSASRNSRRVVPCFVRDTSASVVVFGAPFASGIASALAASPAGAEGLAAAS